MAYEYLAAGPPERGPADRRPVWPWVVGGAAVLVLMLAVAAVVGDWALRNVEMRSFVAAVESSEQAMSDTQAAVREAFAPFEGQESLGDADQEALRAALSDVARAGAVGVADGARAVESVRILPWHTALLDARTAYLEHNQAWQDYLTTAAEDPAEFVVPQAAVASTWDAAEPAVRSALPVPTLFGLSARVDAIFADAAPPDGAPEDAAPPDGAPEDGAPEDGSTKDAPSDDGGLQALGPPLT